MDECSGKENKQQQRYLKATQVGCESSDQDKRPQEKQVYINYLLYTEENHGVNQAGDI